MLTEIALGGAVASFFAGTVAGWVAVVTTATGAIVADIEAGRYVQLAISYSVTARRLETLRATFRDSTRDAPATAEQARRFVEACEAAISVENQGWMAEWSRDQ